jgi:hypothetical protein
MVTKKTVLDMRKKLGVLISRVNSIMNWLKNLFHIHKWHSVPESWRERECRCGKHQILFLRQWIDL